MQNLIDEYRLVYTVYDNYDNFKNFIQKEIISFQTNKNLLSILELGSGTGIITDIILNSKKNIQITSIDDDNNAIKVTREKFSDKNNIEFICTDILDYIRNTKETFDIVISAFTIHNFTQNYRNNFYTSIYKVMSQDSLFLNADKYSPDNNSMRNKALQNIIKKYFDVFSKEGEIDLLKYWVLHYIDDQSPDKVMKLTDTLNIMKIKGFENLEYIYKDESKMLAILKARKKV